MSRALATVFDSFCDRFVGDQGSITVNFEKWEIQALLLLICLLDL